MSETVSETWYAELESTIFTTVQYELKTKNKAPYPNLNCTTISQTTSPAKFPTLYLHELPAVEIGNDLVNQSVNAVRYYIEIQVFSNQSENEVRKILAAATLVMKKLMFSVTAFPDPSTAGDVKSGVARYSRVIANGDDLALGKVNI